MSDFSDKVTDLAGFLLKALLVLAIIRVGFMLLGYEYHIPIVDDFINLIYQILKKSVGALERLLMRFSP